MINHALNPINAFKPANNKKFNNAAPNKIGNAPRINNVIAPSNSNLAPSFNNLLNKCKANIPMNVNKLTINDAPSVANNERTNGIAMFNNFIPKKLRVVNGNRSKNAGIPTNNGNAKIAPISTIALMMSKTSFNNLNGRLTRATKPNANLLNKLSAGRIVHRGNVRSVAPMFNRSNATCAKPLMNVNPQSNAFVTNCANNGNPSHNAGKIPNCVVSNFVKKISGVNKLITNGTPTNANKSFNTFDVKYVNTNERTLKIAFPSKLFNSPRSASGRPKNNATKAAGTVNKFNPGTNAVNNPLRMIGSKNNGASRRNGSPPNSARNKPTANAAIAAGIKLSKPFTKKMIGNEISLRANFVKKVPMIEINGKLIHVNGFNNANGPKIGANSNIPANHTKNGTTKLMIESINIINGNPMNKLSTDNSNVTNGAKKIVSIIKLKNGIKLGNANKNKAISGNLNESNNNPSNATKFNAANANKNGNAKALSKPKPANTNGSTKNVPNRFNSNSGNPIKLNNVN